MPQLDSANFYSKVAKLYKAWETDVSTSLTICSQSSFDAFLFTLGQVKEEGVQPQTSQFHLWLLSYQFSDTVVVMTKEKMAFLVTEKKSKYLSLTHLTQRPCSRRPKRLKSSRARCWSSKCANSRITRKRR